MPFKDPGRRGNTSPKDAAGMLNLILDLPCMITRTWKGSFLVLPTKSCALHCGFPYPRPGSFVRAESLLPWAQKIHFLPCMNKASLPRIGTYLSPKVRQLSRQIGPHPGMRGGHERG